jgi:hypothetical protein
VIVEESDWQRNLHATKTEENNGQRRRHDVSPVIERTDYRGSPLRFDAPATVCHPYGMDSCATGSVGYDGRIVSRRSDCAKDDFGDFGEEVHWLLDASDPAAIGFTDDEKPSQRAKGKRQKDRRGTPRWRRVR